MSRTRDHFASFDHWNHGVCTAIRSGHWRYLLACSKTLDRQQQALVVPRVYVIL